MGSQQQAGWGGQGGQGDRAGQSPSTKPQDAAPSNHGCHPRVPNNPRYPSGERPPPHLIDWLLQCQPT
eukprot:4338673-Alexandrium_andersonii.AAC.1